MTACPQQCLPCDCLPCDCLPPAVPTCLQLQPFHASLPRELLPLNDTVSHALHRPPTTTASSAYECGPAGLAWGWTSRVAQQRLLEQRAARSPPLEEKARKSNGRNDATPGRVHVSDLQSDKTTTRDINFPSDSEYDSPGKARRIPAAGQNNDALFEYKHGIYERGPRRCCGVRQCRTTSSNSTHQI